VEPTRDTLSSRRSTPGHLAGEGTERAIGELPQGPVLTGGTKKRQQHDIDTAKALWADYKRRRRPATY
jgi:hypothetical protein